MHFHEKPNTYVTNVEIKILNKKRNSTKIPKYYVYWSSISHQPRHVADVFLCNLGLSDRFALLSDTLHDLSDNSSKHLVRMPIH